MLSQAVSAGEQELLKKVKGGRKPAPPKESYADFIRRTRKRKGRKKLKYVI